MPVRKDGRTGPRCETAAEKEVPVKQKVPKNAKMPFMRVIKKKWRLLVMLLPAMLFVLIFSYLPMTGIILAFKKYQVAGGVFFSPWNGLKNFKMLFLTNKM